MRLNRSTENVVAMMILLAALAAVSCRLKAQSADAALNADHHAAKLKGAGATSPAPIYFRWFEQFAKLPDGFTVEYQAIGSGGGIKGLYDNTVDFAGSDVPLTPQEKANLPFSVKQIPTVGRTLAMIYNLPGAGTGLRLTPEIIADIYLGRIKRWRDARIGEINPNLRLPDLPITPMHRSDGNGNTYLFTQFLSKVSAAWSSGPGVGKTVKWPVGYGARRSDLIMGMVRHTTGAIVYDDFAYTIQNRLPYAAIRNRAARFVLPSVEGGAAALQANVEALIRDGTASTVDAGGVNSYPICGPTYVIIPQTGRPPAIQAVRFWTWVMQPAQQSKARTLYYVPLPAQVARHNADLLRTDIADTY